VSGMFLRYGPEGEARPALPLAAPDSDIIGITTFAIDGAGRIVYADDVAIRRIEADGTHRVLKEMSFHAGYPMVAANRLGDIGWISDSMFDETGRSTIVRLSSSFETTLVLHRDSRDHDDGLKWVGAVAIADDGRLAVIGQWQGKGNYVQVFRP